MSRLGFETHILLLTPELESGKLDRSPTTLRLAVIVCKSPLMKTCYESNIYTIKLTCVWVFVGRRPLVGYFLKFFVVVYK